MDQRPDENPKGKGTEEGNRDRRQGDREEKKLTPSDAPNQSFETGTGEESTGFDSPAPGSTNLSNPEVFDLEGNRDNESTSDESGEGDEPGDQTRVEKAGYG